MFSLDERPNAMNNIEFQIEQETPRRGVLVVFILILSVIALLLALAVNGIGEEVPAETSTSTPDTTQNKVSFEKSYATHESYDLGGHIASTYGSGAMYDTLVNLHTGPRLLNSTLQMNALPVGQHIFFDSLFISNNGYGGDPNDSTVMRASKGKLYDFQGMFRRDRQYFDYDLLGNPLITPVSVTATAAGGGTYIYPNVTTAPHLFNTVRRMTDIDFTFFPVSKFHVRTGYSKNIMQGPSYSSMHEGTEGLLLQSWRTSTDELRLGVDWKVVRRTTVTLEEHVTHFKGNTTDQLAGLNYQLTNGVPVSIGFDAVTNNTAPVCTGYASYINNATTKPPTVNADCSTFQSYIRNQATRTIFPTEEFRFQTAYWEKLQMNGRVMYTGGNSNMPNLYDYFNGLSGTNRQIIITGNANAERIDVTGDYGMIWQVTKHIAITNQYDFADWRQPGTGSLTTATWAGANAAGATATSSSNLTPINPLPYPSVVAGDANMTAAASTAVTSNYLGMKSETDTTLVNWQASPKASVSIGYRYRVRNINVTFPVAGLNTTAVRPVVKINENTALLGAVIQPNSQWKINANFEGSYADKSYTQISPRQSIHYQLRSRYKPAKWAYISGTINDLERRDSSIVSGVVHYDHSRSATMTADITPNERYGINASYGYSDVYSSTNECYLYLPTGTAPAAATGCTTAYPQLVEAYIDEPTQYGDFGAYGTVLKKLRADVGYRISSVSGNTTLLNPVEPLGALDSQYQTPYAKVAWAVSKDWIYRTEWNYYGYGEGPIIGPTAARTFHGNVYTLSMHYEF